MLMNLLNHFHNLIVYWFERIEYSANVFGLDWDSPGVSFYCVDDGENPIHIVIRATQVSYIDQICLQVADMICMNGDISSVLRNTKDLVNRLTLIPVFDFSVRDLQA